jgi:hypothetical protein
VYRLIVEEEEEEEERRRRETETRAQNRMSKIIKDLDLHLHKNNPQKYKKRLTWVGIISPGVSTIYQKT